jgi:uncharacterized coiled-coil protein SlyX
MSMLIIFQMQDRIKVLESIVAEQAVLLKELKEAKDGQDTTHRSNRKPRAVSNREPDGQPGSSSG